VLAATISDTASKSRASWDLSPPRLPLARIQLASLTEAEGLPAQEGVGDSSSPALASTGPRLYKVASGESTVSSGSRSSTSFPAFSGQPPQMNSLAVRGKGQYTCPEGPNCTKGGLQANGEIVVFERNSAFRYVILHRLLPQISITSSSSSWLGM
jgi:hypothetical protein